MLNKVTITLATVLFLSYILYYSYLGYSVYEDFQVFDFQALNLILGGKVCIHTIITWHLVSICF